MKVESSICLTANPSLCSGPAAARFALRLSAQLERDDEFPPWQSKRQNGVQARERPLDRMVGQKTTTKNKQNERFNNVSINTNYY